MSHHLAQLVGARPDLRPTRTVERSAASFFVVDDGPDPPARVFGHVFVGSERGVREDDFAWRLRVLAEEDEREGRDPRTKHVPLLDVPEQNLLEDAFPKCHAFLDGVPIGERCAVFCHMGASRSVAVAVSYWMLMRARRNLDPDLMGCLDELRRVRPCARPNEGFMKQLREYEARLRREYVVAGAPPSSTIVPPARSPSSVFVRAKRVAALARFAYVLARPALMWTSLGGWLWKRTRVWLVFFLALAWDALRDDVFRASLWGRLGKAKSGLFLGGTHRRGSETLRAIVRKCPSIESGHRPSIWSRALGGDAATVSFLAGGYRPRPVDYVRQSVPRQAGGRYSLDWAFPETDGRHACLIMAGIGGNSESPYVKCVARALLDRGFVVCVLMARGLGPCDGSSESVDHVYNPTDDSDVHDVVATLSKRHAQVCLVGFSLGGVTTCRYFCNYPVPENVACGVAVSGGFNVDFISLPRYENVYQPLLVPSLVDDVVSKHGQALARRVGDASIVDDVQSSSTYREVHRRLYVRGDLPGVEKDFDSWKQKLGGDPSRVRRPLLVLTAMDDPLHHVEMLGINHVFGDETALAPAEDVAVLVTRAGGHVAWPERDFSKEGYSFVRRVVYEFCSAAVEQGLSTKSTA